MADKRNTVSGSSRRKPTVNTKTYGIKAQQPNTSSGVTQGKPANKLSRAAALNKVRG